MTNSVHLAPARADSRLYKICMLIARLGLAYLFFTQLWWKLPPRFGCANDFATPQPAAANHWVDNGSSGLCYWMGLESVFAPQDRRVLVADMRSAGGPDIGVNIKPLAQANALLLDNLIIPGIRFFGWGIWLAEFWIFLSLFLGLFSRLGALVAIGITAQLYIGLANIPRPYEWEWAYGAILLLSVALLGAAPGRFIGVDAWLRPRLASSAARGNLLAKIVLGLSQQAANEMQSERRVTASLALIGAASAGLYALLALRYPLALSLANPRASWADLTAATWASFACHTAIYLGLTVLYIWALRLLTPTPDAPHQLPAAHDRTYLILIVLTWLVCCGILLTAASSGESHDIFDYIFRGRMMTVLGANPLTDVPTQYRGAPHFDYLAWHDHVDAYGPVWEMMSAATSAVTRAVLGGVGTWTTSNTSCPQSPLACRSLIGYVSAYRLLAVGLTGLSGWLIVSMVRRSRPHHAAAALAAWLLSPLLLVSTAIGAHNDAAMLVPLLLMLWLLQRRRWFPALLVLVLAAHVKLTVVIVTPVVGLWLVRRCGWRRTTGLGAAAAAVGLLFSWLLYVPFGGWGSLPRMLTERAAYLANSPWRVLYLFLSTERGWPFELARRLTVQLATVLAAAGVLLVSLWMLDFRPRRWQAAPAPDWRDDRLLWRSVAAVTLLYLLIGSFWFQHWYLVWVLAPAALLPDSLLTRRWLPWLGFGALTANLVSAFAPALAPEPLTKMAMAALIVAVIWTPMLIAGGWHLGCLRARRNQDGE